ncbi:DUF6415 family natural product biosynthesis protein [Streptomyces violaceusniger]|uniref:Uncharacterized protein n=1 Tax=Streptomyces violaceusniger (strain Tu 4113) TaxID=653045 RepID=G2P9V3_STRV4|nr:DUF6415 family natural product biosynthesis protein [Streptomyces violaceusniger]AEM80244.1 hypothetical protein Strvi_0466 [Streptomyces violaceusniger Tu 4113]
MVATGSQDQDRTAVTGPQEVDVEQVKGAIVRALVESSTVPRYEDLCELREVLIGHIKTLTPLATKQIDRLNHGTVEWYGKASKLRSISYEVAAGLGHGLLSAKAHVQGLGYTCRFLLENSGLQGERKG